jgi:hypothetical protein
MPLPVHTVEIIDGGAPLSNPDRLKLVMLFGVANAAGGGAGAAVTTPISGIQLPPNYFVDIELSQDATYFITGKTQTGFNVVMNPRLAANTLAAGTFNIKIFA